MTNVPNLIDRAEAALRTFEGEPLDREQAERLLSMWGQRDELSDGDWADVLARFPVAFSGRPEIASADVGEALRRIGGKLRDARQREREAFDNGYMEALSDVAEAFRVGKEIGRHEGAAAANPAVYALGIQEGERRSLKDPIDNA